MSRKTARNANHRPDPERKKRADKNHDRNLSQGFANRHEERGHIKETKKAKIQEGVK